MIPADSKQPYDVREVIARLVDGSEFDEFKALFGTTLVCGFAHLHGYPIAILANNGIPSPRLRRKARTSSNWPASGIPLLFLQNITGFMVGQKYEAGGIASTAPLVTAVACARVPKFTVLIGGSFGAGNYMCGRAYDPRFLWMWPNARIGADGRRTGRRGARPVKRDEPRRPAARRRRGGEDQGADPRTVRAPGPSLLPSARLWDDGVIDPAQTREVLALALSAAPSTPLSSRLPSACSACDEQTSMSEFQTIQLRSTRAA